MANVKKRVWSIEIFPVFGKFLVEFLHQFVKSLRVRSGPAICSNDLSCVFNILVCSQPTIFVTFEQLDAQLCLHPNPFIELWEIYFLFSPKNWHNSGSAKIVHP
jgi:hypothetical protein